MPTKTNKGNQKQPPQTKHKFPAHSLTTWKFAIIPTNETNQFNVDR